MDLTILPYSTWRWKLLILWHVLALALIQSLFTPVWNGIDTYLFRALNAPLEHSHSLRLFWAAANHRLADWFEDLCILAFIIAAIWKAPKTERKRRGAEMIFGLFLVAATILVVNRFFCRDLMKLRRESPTLVLDQAVLLSDYITSFTVKVVSTKSLPGDHATTAILFATIYAYFVRGKLALLALIYGALLCLPRLAVGAHWPSDIFVGSGAIVFITLSWAFCTPFAKRSIEKIEKILHHF